jgi:hypothetical protein
LQTKFLTFATVSVVALLALGKAAPAESIRTCAYDPDSGKPNPLGMRAYITLSEVDGNTTALFEQFPSPVGGSQQRVTIASSRQLTFYGVDINRARRLMLQDPTYYSELVGYPDSEGFAPVDQTLVCHSEVK